jgi:hypothetical protein
MTYTKHTARSARVTQRLPGWLRWIMQNVFAIAAALVLTGCYSHVPVVAQTPPSSATIIARMTDLGAARLASVVGAGATEIEGTVVSASDTAWQVSLSLVRYRGLPAARWGGEEVLFPRWALTDVRERRLSRKRTWIVVGAATAVFLTILRAAENFGEENAGRGQPVVPPA